MPRHIGGKYGILVDVYEYVGTFLYVGFPHIFPVFRRSTVKVPTFQISPVRFKSPIYLKRLDFTGKFNVLTGHFFIEKIFYMLYNSSTT